LVVDVGGGTFDFTLVQVGDNQALRRIAVGDHLMLGGDNMDAAIARRAEERMKAAGKLGPAQWAELVQLCRLAKESLLSERPPENYHLSVVSEGNRLIEAVSSWHRRDGPIRVLEHASLDLSVARGAAYYALVRRGMGRRIGGGTAHAFYVGLESKDEPKALCLISRGQEEGQEVEISGRKFNLTLGWPVQFPLFTS